MGRLARLALPIGLALMATVARAEAPCAPDGPSSLLVRFAKPSLSGEVFVVDGPRCRYLRFGSPFGADQSVVSLADPEAVPTEYVRIAAVGLAIARRPERVLLVGLGGGTFARVAARAWPAAEIDAVEIDPVVVEAATRFFGVERSARRRIHVGDAAEFLASGERRFDLVFLDTYGPDGLPEALSSEAYFRSAAARLRPGGVVVANFGLGKPAEYLALARRLRAAAGEALCLSGREEANLVVFAGAPELLRREPIASRAAELDARRSLPFALTELTPRLRPCL